MQAGFTHTSFHHSLLRIIHQEQLKALNKKLVDTDDCPSPTVRLISMCETLNAICDVCNTHLIITRTTEMVTALTHTTTKTCSG